MAASARGSHLLAHGPRALLQDWLAWPLIGPEAETIPTRASQIFGTHAPLLATWISARSRIAEDWLADSGAGQYLILGAGLDTFAWRQARGVRVFEVDHPATQDWKRSRLGSLGAPEPPGLVWVPVDFETESLGDALVRAGIGGRSTFVSWLGVVSYLSLEAIEATLRGLPPCSLAVSYGYPQEAWPPVVRELTERFRAIAAQSGERPLTRFTSDQFAELLAASGFQVVEEVGFEDVEPLYGLPALSIGCERVVLATKPGQLISPRSELLGFVH
jgi:methyltransferase (TIGR00027 family)